MLNEDPKSFAEIPELMSVLADLDTSVIGEGEEAGREIRSCINNVNEIENGVKTWTAARNDAKDSEPILNHFTIFLTTNSCSLTLSSSLCFRSRFVSIETIENPLAGAYWSSNRDINYPN